MNKDINKAPFKIIAFTFFWLLVISVFVPNKVWQKLSLTKLDITADLYDEGATKRISTYKPKSETKPLKDIIKDTIASNQAITKIIRNDVAIEHTGSSKADGILNFNQALYELKGKKRKKVRIAYFGDSMIEGDLVTQTIRDLLQQRFGGVGVGFFPVSSIVAHYRQTIKVKANENWRDVHFNNNKQKEIIGFSGHTFFANEGAACEIKSGSLKQPIPINQLSLWCGSAQNPLLFSVGDNLFQTETKGYFNKLVIGNDIKRISIVFQKSEVPIYGFSAESATGLILDNFSFRGTSGTELLRLNSKMLKQIDSLHHYDLVVLHYGPNLLWNDSIVDFSWYKQQMVKTIKHLKKAFPFTSFLIISTADKAFKMNGVYETARGVEPLLLAQQKIAIETGCAFYNLYEAMGGYNSMKTWVEKKPFLAGNDYTHFNMSGSAKIGRLITNALLNEYVKKYPAD
ncbi:MAG: hypothetical protein MUC81_00260 [Bacteroidia bacterium]|nr:hypothetical protein [Bacteroidia bacterium]